MLYLQKNIVIAMLMTTLTRLQTVPNLNFGSNYYNTTSNYVQNFKRVFCFSLIHFVALITFYTPKNIRKLMAS